MKFGGRVFVSCALAGVAVWGYAGQDSDQPSDRPPSLHQPDERPTLGPRNGPGDLSGPDNSTTTDIKKLARIHTLYIESMDNSLNEKLVESIGKWGRFQLVTKAKDADAILRGSCLESRRLKRMHSEVFISDRNGGSIWQDTIYRPFNPPALDQAVTETADVVQVHLAKTLRDARQRQ